MANTPYTTTAPVGVGRFEYLQFQYNLADIAAGDILVDFVVPFAFKVVGITATAVKIASTASKAATIAVKIDGNAVTGASVALTTSNMGTLGAVVSATATDITANGNNQSALAGGSKLRLTASSVTAFVEGIVNLAIVLQSLEA